MSRLNDFTSLFDGKFSACYDFDKQFLSQREHFSMSDLNAEKQNKFVLSMEYRFSNYPSFYQKIRDLKHINRSENKSFISSFHNEI